MLKLGSGSIQFWKFGLGPTPCDNLWLKSSSRRKILFWPHLIHLLVARILEGWKLLVIIFHRTECWSCKSDLAYMVTSTTPNIWFYSAKTFLQRIYEFYQISATQSKVFANLSHFSKILDCINKGFMKLQICNISALWAIISFPLKLKEDENMKAPIL